MDGLDPAQVAEKFGVSERTARRWLAKFGLYKPRSGYGPGKITEAQAIEIRDARKAGEPVKDLAARYGVTLATIYRVASKNHRPSKDTAIVTVIYNPNISRERSASEAGGRTVDRR